MCLAVGCTIIFILFNAKSCASSAHRFPADFAFGVATAAYQVEGAWNASGKGESIWDHGAHADPSPIRDRSNGDVACDSYHKFREDVQLARSLGVGFYRFSISWPRILPTGRADRVNPDGVRYYNALIDELLANGLQPLATMYHWDLPQPLQLEGGWPNRTMVGHFVEYARVLFENFGDRVKRWITVNEILEICELGYATGVFAPFLRDAGVGDYECAHTLLLAHGAAYRLYDERFRPQQRGQVGITIDSFWFEPGDPTSAADRAAAETLMQMNYGWFGDPVMLGGYPRVMVERVRAASLAEGRNRSRLPEFSPREAAMVRGSFDFLGLNHYTTFRCRFAAEGEGARPSHWADVGVATFQEACWERAASDWLAVVPWGFRKFLVWVKERYGNPPILVTENGFSDRGELDDYKRANYLKLYLAELLKAIHEDGCNVTGYTVWSLLDNFEWNEGYTQKFGLFHVDFDDPQRARTPKLSSYVYRHIVATKRVQWDYYPDWPRNDTGL